MKQNSEMKIGIVGAGAAGLTAADVLKEKGYKNVTVLERSAVPGGKCCSMEYEGRPYELGAGVISANSDTVLGLVKKYGVRIHAVSFDAEIIFVDIKDGKHVPKKRSVKSAIYALKDLFFKYKRLARRYREISKPGFIYVDKDLCIPFSQWAAKHNIPFIADEFISFFSGFGYGYFDEIPAAYVLKYYSWASVRAFLGKKIFGFTDGIQMLWKTVAGAHDVIYDIMIESIERGGDITVKTNKGEFVFDKLIVTSPLDEALNFMDASAEEKDLFSRIDYCDYRTYALIIKGFPKQDGYLPDNFHSNKKGQPIFWHSWYTDLNFYTFYVLGDWKISDEEVLKNIESVINDFGGKLEKVHVVKHWKYFPHISQKEMENGYFNKVEELQGKNGTYFAGELLNFSMVELSAAYAKDLVERFF